MLYALQDKLDLLIKKYKSLKENEAALQKKVASLEFKIANQQEQIELLEETLMVKGMVQNGDQDAIKLYIDAIIEEIDLTIKKL